ncbi:MAG: hypothetical protein ACRDTF_23965 [Pseudonocardiaceae bacterium]
MRRVSAVSSALLCVAALVLLLPGVPAGPEMADRVAWAAAVWGLPRLLGYARAALSARRVTLPLLAGTALLAIAVAGLPVVTAVVVATVLVSDLTRRSSAAASDSMMIDAGHAQRV